MTMESVTTRMKTVIKGNRPSVSVSPVKFRAEAEIRHGGETASISIDRESPVRVDLKALRGLRSFLKEVETKMKEVQE